MKPARRSTLRLLLVLGALTLQPSDASPQDPCPGASSADAEAGWTSYRAGDIAEARARFTAALDRCGNDQYARTGQGYVELRGGNTAAARALLAAVIDVEPYNVDALVGLGLAAWRIGDLAEVRERFELVLELAPGDPTAVEYLDRVAAAERAETGPADAADAAWSDGNAEVALELYSARLDTNPRDGLALLRVGLIRAWSEQYDDALELLNLLIDLEPANAEARLAHARVVAWSGDIPRAQREVRRVLEIAPDNTEALATLALFQSWSGQLDEALSSYDQLLSIAPEHGAGRRQQALAMAWAADYERSLASYRDLVQRHPSDLEARLGLATTLAYSGAYREAVEQYDQVLSLAPREMRALTGKARTLGWAGRLMDSESAALRAVEMDDADGPAWAALGQAYRLQGRDAEAREAFQLAAGFAPLDADIRDQLRSARLALAPLARPTVTGERDSDGNRMVTTSLEASWHPVDRFDLRASGYHRRLEQDAASFLLERRAFGGMLTGSWQFRPGWLVTGGVGGSATDGPGDPTFLSVRGSVRTPDRNPVGLTLSFSSEGLDETAAMAQRGIRSTQALVAARWFPGPRWRVDGSVGAGSYEGSEKNGRREAYLGASRRIGGSFSLGASFRGFSFEKNLGDGYFDPDFYGVAELTGYWLWRPAPWSVLVEAAPGVQQVRQDGDPSGSVRANARIGYQVGDGREISLSFGYSTAGLNSSASGADGYSYNALILGVNWVF